MMIVRDSEWILSEVGERITFYNRKDKETKLICRECRFIIVERNLALNLHSDESGKGRICFTNRTLRSFENPRKANCTFNDVLNLLRQTADISADITS